MAKKMVYEMEAQQSLAAGVGKLARAVRSTLGPRGRNAVLDKGCLSQWAGRRDHALLLTLYNTGARVSEMTGLQKTQVHFGTKTFVQFKGRDERSERFPCGPRQAALCEHGLRNWIPTHDITHRQPSPMLAARP